MLDLKQNYFALFSLPASFAVDTDALMNSYRALQQVVHPDKFASGTAQEKRLSLQAASYINEAYQVLSCDLRRASYLLLLNGIDIGAETDTNVDPLFLMTQIEYREQLESIPASKSPFSVLDTLRSAIGKDVEVLQQTLSGQLHDKHFDAARDTVRRWQFLEK